MTGDQHPGRVPGTRPPAYVIILAASDWSKEHNPANHSTSGTPCTPARTVTATPNPTWKPNHDHDPGATVMTLTITDTAMTSDHSTHTARHTPEWNGWVVSWLPGRLLDRNTAVTAMTLADTAAVHTLHENHRLWPHIQGWAAELGLTAPEAIASVSEPGESGITRRDAFTERAEPEAGT